jgi:hypothetical protein
MLTDNNLEKTQRAKKTDEKSESEHQSKLC